MNPLATLIDLTQSYPCCHVPIVTLATAAYRGHEEDEVLIEEPKKLIIRDTNRRPTAAQIAAFKGVPTGFVADAQDGLGAMDARIGPVGDGRDFPCAMAGPAITAFNRPGDVLATLAALKFVQAGDVLVAGFSGHQGCASAGDRVCGMLKNCQAAGLVTDGPMRDYQGIVEVGLPSFCTGLTPASPVAAGPGVIGGAVDIGGLRVETGDMIVADRDGVVVVPFDTIDAVLLRLEHVAKLENDLDQEVRQGLKIPKAIEDFLDSDEVQYLS